MSSQLCETSFGVPFSKIANRTKSFEIVFGGFTSLGPRLDMVDVKYNRWVSRRRSAALSALEIVAFHNSKAKPVRYSAWVSRISRLLRHDLSTRGAFGSIDIGSEGS